MNDERCVSMRGPNWDGTKVYLFYCYYYFYFWRRVGGRCELLLFCRKPPWLEICFFQFVALKAARRAELLRRTFVGQAAEPRWPPHRRFAWRRRGAPAACSFDFRPASAPDMVPHAEGARFIVEGDNSICLTLNGATARGLPRCKVEGFPSRCCRSLGSPRGLFTAATAALRAGWAAHEERESAPRHPHDCAGAQLSSQRIQLRCAASCPAPVG
ncbi:hypothetical protein TraAM80_10025 [Trypanosoma rangeli]|uniref:Uncharacterized protein n=1 Tax=Trypanosoma rangeli TaxID=5698 RepID=A0A422MS13_TRYRA|nr:uncharacterized protein TraAM80_10025 [Trypanosoma rangeli]RNE95987.1 hypothetical protein TraAM80_10025 [Trypanosoma rangeli]|eukprot:RNE95987.1 hypothetical protein TraAM80_10025 [Trypanosoma rangeli]